MSAPVRVGILGFGDRGVSFVAPILNNHYANSIRTIIDPDISRSRFFLNECVKQGQIPADEAEAIRFIADISELGEDEIDALFLTASERVRTEVFAAAVATGVHLYMEKGLSHDLAGGRTVVEATHRARPGQGIFMGFNLRHLPAAQHVRRVLDSGRIGRPLFIQYTERLQFSHGASYYMRFHRDVENSGGLLVTKACHDLDLMSWFAGGRPRRVFSAQYQQLFGKGGEEAREQCHTCDRADSCDFNRIRLINGRAAQRKYAKIYLDEDKVTTDGYFRDICCWRDDTKLCDLHHVVVEHDNGVPATYTQVLFSPEPNRIVTVFCEDGSVELNEHERAVTVRDRWNTLEDRTVCKPGVAHSHGGADTGVVAAFFRMVREGEIPESTIDDGAWALATAYAAYESAAAGQYVPVGPMFDAMITEVPECALV